ncbi:MAG: hypothetical protein AAB440_00005 [Patescibacteria group bacterium]
MSAASLFSAIVLFFTSLLGMGISSPPETPLLPATETTTPIIREEIVEEESAPPQQEVIKTKSKISLNVPEPAPPFQLSTTTSVLTATTSIASVATTSLTNTHSRSVSQSNSSVPKIPLISEEAQEPTYSLSSAGREINLSISSAEDADPKFISAVIAPLHVYVGQTQTFTVNVQSTKPIISVVATMELDHETVTLNLVPDSNGSTFSASWVVYDTHVKMYHTTFTAENAGGDTTSIVLAWSDPCSGITQGMSSSLSSDCTVSSVSGLDGGDLTIPNGVTLTLNSGTTWAWNPGTTVTVNGSIVKSGSAQIKKGYLFYSGSTNDSADTNTMVFDAASTKSGHVRAGTWFSFSPIYDASLTAVQYSNVVTIGGIPNGSTVTLNDSGQGESAIGMSVNGGAWVTSGTMNPGDTLGLKFRPGSEYLTTYWVQASVDGASSVFQVTTNAGGGGCEFNCP